MEIGQVSAQSHVLSSRGARQEAKEVLKVVDHDLGQALAFSAFRGSQSRSTNTLSVHIPANTQNMAGGIPGGQEGVLDLRTMHWTPVQRNLNDRSGDVANVTLETVQQNASSNQDGMSLGETSTYLQMMPTDLNLRGVSRCKLLDYRLFHQ